MGDYRATPGEIGRLRKEIREAVAQEKEYGYVNHNTFLKAATLDDHCFMWLRQRLRPQELALLDKMCPRSPWVGSPT